MLWLIAIGLGTMDMNMLVDFSSPAVDPLLDLLFSFVQFRVLKACKYLYDQTLVFEGDKSLIVHL
jgi:hypothetical protein